MLRMQLNVEPDPAEVGRARRWARSRLTGSGIGPDEPLAEALVLIVSELVTNAVVHTGCPAVLRMCVPAGPGGHCEDGTVRIEVADSSGRPPVPRRAGGDDSGGRGLELVDGLADRWGWQREGAGKRIWCEVDRRASLVLRSTGTTATGAYGAGVTAAGLPGAGVTGATGTGNAFAGTAAVPPVTAAGHR